MSAAAVILERHIRDGIGLADIGQWLFPFAGIFAGGGCKTRRTMQHIKRTRHTARRCHGRHGAGFRRMAGMQRLGHAFTAEGLLQPACHGGASCNGMRGAFRIAIQRDGHRRRRTKSADRAGGMPEIVVRRLHRNTDAARNLIPRNHGAQQQIHIRAARLRCRQRRRNSRAAGMINGVAINIVEFHGMRRRAIQ